MRTEIHHDDRGLGAKLAQIGENLRILRKNQLIRSSDNRPFEKCGDWKSTDIHIPIGNIDLPRASEHLCAEFHAAYILGFIKPFLLIWQIVCEMADV